MRISTLWVLGALALAGCGETTTTSTSPPARPSAEKPAPDNTAINKRDANGATPTPIDQDENQRDLKITADIRQRVMKEADLSVNARNAKIITSEGKVTLRGPVASAEEKDTLGKIALAIAGDGNVTNLLEVAEP